MKGTKKTFSVLAGLLMAAICTFEISETSRFISMISGGNNAYIGELVIKSIYILAMISAGVFFILDKCPKLTATLLAVAGGVSLYKTFTYIMGIRGNEMIFGIVYGNVTDMVIITLFIAPTAVLLLSGGKISKKLIRNSLIFEFAALAVGISGYIASFAAWGKTFADFGLFFDVYGLDILRIIVCFLAFALTIAAMAPEEEKKRR